MTRGASPRSVCMFVCEGDGCQVCGAEGFRQGKSLSHCQHLKPQCQCHRHSRNKEDIRALLKYEAALITRTWSKVVFSICSYSFRSDRVFLLPKFTGFKDQTINFSFDKMSNSTMYH